MAALAGIGDLPDTIEDRAVIVTMRRRAPGEQVSSFRRRRDLPALVTLRDRLHCWLRDHLPELETAEPAMPVEDRAADTWEPLVAVADLAGGGWPTLAREACRTMTAEASADDDGSLGERLLADLREVFADDDRLDSDHPGSGCMAWRKRPGPTCTARDWTPAGWPGCCGPTASGPRCCGWG
jgi:hypothetical protein